MTMLPHAPDPDAAQLADRALHEIAHNFASAMSEIEAASEARLAEVEARLQASLTREARICKALQQRLFELESELQSADDRRASEAGAFADQVARRHAEFTANLTRTLQARDALAGELAAATAALDAEQQGRRADAAAAAEHLRRREAELAAVRSEGATARATLERTLAQMDAAQRQAALRADLDLAAAHERQAALEDLLAQEGDRRTRLEQKLAAMEAAVEAADQRHTTDLARAAARLAEVQAQYDAAVTEHTLERAALTQQLAGAERDVAAVRTEAARRGHRLLHVVSAYRRRAREQKGVLEAQLTAVRADAARERDEKDAFRARLAATHGELAQLQREHQDDRLVHERARFASESELRRISAEHARERDEKNAVLERLGAAQEQVLRLQREGDDERRAHEFSRVSTESELQRISADNGQLRQSFDRLQTAFQTMEEIASAHASERGRLEGVVEARDGELLAQAQRHRAAEQASREAFAETEATLRLELAAGGAARARLQQARGALLRDLDASRTQADGLRREAERVAAVQAELELSQKERRREFERAPYGLCICTPAGVITDANHSFVAMLGMRRVDDLRDMNFADAVFDSAGDLGWVLERARTMRRTESVETNWKTRDGRDLFVRLQAAATSGGAVEILVEDITLMRGLEERLRQAQRIEAVGRLASEVAVTCDALLGDVARGLRQWAEANDSPDALRYGDAMLTDLTRAASFLRQLGVYGEEQVRALEPVSVQRVLGDLAPVLRRVVGDQIALVLSKSSGSFDVDVEAERLERVLVNVAGYARQRMPHGGQMRIDVATTALGRRFTSRYPNVRPGHHVLITVTEVARSGQTLDLAGRGPQALDRPGVELATLVDLVGSCGGHLWLEAQPAGNLVVKVYLPRRTGIDSSETNAPSSRAQRGGRLARWFRAAPAARLRA